MKSLAVKYRPQTFDGVTEQGSVKTILQNQLALGEIKNAYIFVGSAGCGKTTCARIFANAINKGKGNPIEMDAASNNSVDDVRNIAKMAQTKSLDSDYKVFILDEVHMFSAGAWSAMLKLIEEPPARSVFIMCTTDYWKIPKTILSRSQRFTFNRISTQGIVDRLKTILAWEDEEILSQGGPDGAYRDNCSDDAIEYIARLADGGMRDAITTLDKCLSYSAELSLDNVVKALGTSSFDTFKDLTEALIKGDDADILEIIEQVFASGEDMKQFLKTYIDFVMDMCKVSSMDGDFSYTHLPDTKEMKTWIANMSKAYPMIDLVKYLISIDNEIKWSQTPKNVIEARLLTM